ncbi:TetR/AcrR family transcriptional regulator [Bdellovibrio sp. HCB-162]|uniref:TetR/AcrR family transcriptional regulator n=1 Tax=Bdellovibrio sp. HCB-162 TaxID=3394234 RepID=UPI0039BC686A
MVKSYHHGDLKSAAIKKTVEVIQKKGEVDFTLREIAKSLKVSHTAVYRHFKSKQDLLSYIAEEGFLALMQAFEKELLHARTPRQKLQASGRAYIEFALQNPGHYRSMFHQELRCSKEQRKELDEIGAKAFSSLLDILQEGMKAHVFKKEDPLSVARSIWASIHGFSILLLDGQFQSVKSKNDTKNAIDQHLDFLERAVLK